MTLCRPALLLLLTSWLACANAAPPPPCKPCGEWQLDAAASEQAEAVIDTAMSQYKEPKPRRGRVPHGDIDAEAEAELLATLDRMPGPERRDQLRAALLKLLNSPPTLRLRQDRDDIVIEAQGGPTRRVTPGEPHSRVDTFGTAEIDSRWTSGTLTVTETYRRKFSNRETYALDTAGRLKVTRHVARPGMPGVIVHSTYLLR